MLMKMKKRMYLYMKMSRIIQMKRKKTMLM